MRGAVRSTVLTVATVLVSVQAFAYSVKSLAPAAKGCIPRVTLEKAKEAIGKFKLQTKNATPQETIALGTGLHWIAALNGGEPLEEAIGRNGYNYLFRTGFGSSHQAANEIVITRNGGKNYGENIAQLVHELGHYIGNNGAYDEYRKVMNGKNCVVSSYSQSRFNEQFAEAFATFVAYPKLMKEIGSPGCRIAYEFFSKQLFSNGLLADRCISKSLRPGVDF